ncbi:SLOG family protein [uncultured Alistipes sp.]|uniref:SLOG family protein n=1 Tax=uncultured Alistipes sp. TaxID=538949 RepID=UPI0026145C95|nr:SLOG family protein [uncultured Alistipes sp.]
MIADPGTTAAFTGHRTYDGTAGETLAAAVERAYMRGYRTFLTGMAMGFDLAAGEAVLALRAKHPGMRLVAVIPFRGQEERFSAEDRARFRTVEAASDKVVILSETFHRGCYAVRNRFLADNASLVVAWYDGSSGGTQYTLRRAFARSLEVWNLHPAAPLSIRTADPELF